MGTTLLKADSHFAETVRIKNYYYKANICIITVYKTGEPAMARQMSPVSGGSFQTLKMMCKFMQRRFGKF